LGVPAHVTILYPFIPPQEITEVELNALRTVFQPFSPFVAGFSEIIEDFEMLYLAPEPKSTFVSLTKAMIRAFPGYLPYQGAYDEILPHLSVALPDDPADLEQIVEEFREAAQAKMPFSAQITHVALMDSLSGSWKIREKFPLLGEM
jgi:hypothetical protein